MWMITLVIKITYHKYWPGESHEMLPPLLREGTHLLLPAVNVPVMLGLTTGSK